MLTSLGDDFDEADFSVPQGDHPDEVSLGPPASSEHFRRRNSLPNQQHSPPIRAAAQNHVPRPRSPLARNHTTGPQTAPQTPMNPGISNLGSLGNSNGSTLNPASNIRPPNLPAQGQQTTSSGVQQLPPPRLPQNGQSAANAHQAEPPSNEPSNPSDHEPPVGFFTARVAESLQSGSGPSVKASAFNPHLESPSIRKTAGVDHSKTKPVGREAISGAASPVVPRTNFVNPQTDKARRLGMPGGGASPLQNRVSYKPPSIKRPVEQHGTRSALGEITAASVNRPSDDGGDVKRQRVGMEAQGATGNEGMLNV